MLWIPGRRKEEEDEASLRIARLNVSLSFLSWCRALWNSQNGDDLWRCCCFFNLSEFYSAKYKVYYIKIICQTRPATNQQNREKQMMRRVEPVWFGVIFRRRRHSRSHVIARITVRKLYEYFLWHFLKDFSKTGCGSSNRDERCLLIKWPLVQPNFMCELTLN